MILLPDISSHQDYYYMFKVYIELELIRFKVYIELELIRLKVYSL